MPKIDKSQYSKQEWKRIREQRRLEKQVNKDRKAMGQAVQQPVYNSQTNNYIVCLKHGHKYTAEYVNKLNSMVKRHCTRDYEFVCFTEDSTDLDSDIKVMPLPSIPNAAGWWYKPMFFSPDFALKGTMLYMDLDVIVFDNIDKLFDYAPGKFCIIRDFNRSIRSEWKKFNSSVFRLESGSLPHVYNNFIKDPRSAIRRFHGDQDWIFDQVRTDFEYWPNEWIQSYKWEMRGRPAMVRDRNGKRNFSAPGTPKILPDTAVAVFHGEPNPHDCVDPWCKQNWY